MCRRKVWGCPSQNNWQRKTFLLLFFFRRLRVNGEYLVSALDFTRGLLHCLKISWTFVYKRLKIGPKFLPTLPKFCILLHCHRTRSSQTEILLSSCYNFDKRKEVNGADGSRIRWRRIMNVNESIEIRSLVSHGPIKIWS